MSYYSVEAKNRKQLRDLANAFRKILSLEDTLYFPIVELLEIMPECFPGFSCEIVDDDKLPAQTHAEADITTGHITIKQTVYDRACAGKRRCGDSQYPFR